VTECGVSPLFKLLPRTYNDFHRVKVRLNRRTDPVSEAFNRAFADYNKLRQRAIFTQSRMPAETEMLEPFYVIPIDGFKYTYSTEVTNSSVEYQQTFSTLIEQFDDTNAAVEIVTDLVSYTYTRQNIQEAIGSGSEVILYNIPYYYAVRCSVQPSYSSLMENIKCQK
jgi:hypothetical protein